MKKLLKKLTPHKYICRLGYASTDSAARVYAESELAKYFSHSVESKTFASQKMNEKQTLDKELTKSVLIKSEIDLIAVKHTQSWYNKKKKQYINCAYIDREQAWNIYKSRLNLLQKEFNASYKSAVGEKDLFTKISLLTQLKEKSVEYENALDFSHTLYPASDTLYEEDKNKIASLESIITEAKNKIFFQLKINNDSLNKITSLVSASINECGYKVVKQNAPYIIQVEIDLGKSYFTDSITANPSVSIIIFGNSKNIFTYEKSCQRITGFKDAENFVDKKIYDSLENEIKASLTNELKSVLK